VNEGINEGIFQNNEGININIEGVNEGTRKTIEKILSYINKKPMVKTSDIEVFIGRSNATTERYLKILRENNYIEYVGANKTGGYKILNSK